MTTGTKVFINCELTKKGVISVDGIIDRKVGSGFMVIVLDIKADKPMKLFFEKEQLEYDDHINFI